MATTFFTADLHLNHANIIKYCGRPFETVEQMNYGLVENWNTVVSPEDDVYIVGDVAMGDVEDALKYVQMLNGVLHLIPGNHDKCWEGHFRGGKSPDRRRRMRELYEDAGFLIKNSEEKIFVAGNSFQVCHFPWIEDARHGKKYTEFRPTPPWGKARLIHGHVHQEWKYNNNMVNVGIDVWNYAPVSIEQIIAEWPTS